MEITPERLAVILTLTTVAGGVAGAWITSWKAAKASEQDRKSRERTQLHGERLLAYSAVCAESWRAYESVKLGQEPAPIQEEGAWYERALLLAGPAARDSIVDLRKELKRLYDKNKGSGAVLIDDEIDNVLRLFKELYRSLRGDLGVPLNLEE